MAHDVFISYSKKDAAVAEAVCAELEARGIQCWIAPRNIVSGTKYSHSIITGITQSQLMVVVYSSNANESNHVVAEIDRAYNKRIPIIPFRIEDVPLSEDLEYYLSTSQWLDALEGPLKDHLERLVETVRLLLKKTGSLPQPPPSSRQVAPGAPPAVVARAGKAPWIIAGSVGLVVFGLVALLAIGIIVSNVAKQSGNRPLANGNFASVTPAVLPSVNARDDAQSTADVVEAEILRRARTDILEAEKKGDKETLKSLLGNNFVTHRPNNQNLNKEQLIQEVDSGQFIEGLKVPDRAKVTIEVSDARASRGVSSALTAVVKFSYWDQGHMITEAHVDITVFVKENDHLVATVNRWANAAAPAR